MLTDDNKIKLVTEKNKILTDGVTLKNFRRLEEINSLLDSDGISDKLTTMFDMNTRRYVHLIQLDDGTYEEFLGYMSRRN